MDVTQKPYIQKIIYGRGMLWAPCYAVGIAVRIRENVPRLLVETVLGKMAILYPSLASRVQIELDGTAWLTTEGVDEFSLTMRPRYSDDDWLALFLEQEQIPFEFRRGPVARFFMLTGNGCTDIVVIAPHVVCDGYSMTHAMIEFVSLLNDPEREVVRPSPPPSVTWDNVPTHIQKGMLKPAGVINALWFGNRTSLNEEGYRDLSQRYWTGQQIDTLSFELSQTETADLVARCKQQQVSITGALVAAFLLARFDVRPGLKSSNGEVGIAVNIRDRLVHSPGLAVGMYASSVKIAMRAIPRRPYWDLARESHIRIHKALNIPHLILRPMLLNELHPAIIDRYFETVCDTKSRRRYNLLSHTLRVLGAEPDLVVSNIGRVDYVKGSPYSLEAILPWPPLLPGVSITVNTLTAGGRMVFVLRYRRHEADGTSGSRVRDRALEYLLGYRTRCCAAHRVKIAFPIPTGPS